MSSRYSQYLHIQPTRKVTPAVTDILHPFSQFDRVDLLAYRFYRDATLGWVIMSANPSYFHEFAIPAGAQIRIPFPLSRVLSELGLRNEL